MQGPQGPQGKDLTVLLDLPESHRETNNEGRQKCIYLEIYFFK